MSVGALAGLLALGIAIKHYAWPKYQVYHAKAVVNDQLLRRNGQLSSQARYRLTPGDIEKMKKKGLLTDADLAVLQPLVSR